MLLCSSIHFTGKRKYCLCDKDLFPGDDCESCGYDESILRHYPDARPLLKVARLQQTNDLEECTVISKDITKKHIQTILKKEKTRLVSNRVEMKRGIHLYYYYVEVADKEEEEEVVDICLELAHDYNACGYKKFKKDYDIKSFNSQGRLLEGSDGARIRVAVGEVTDYVSPSKEVEGIIDKYVKAIAIVETWKTEDSFLKDWNDTVFTGVGEKSNDRYIYMGWNMKTYFGWNMRQLELNDEEEQSEIGRMEAVSMQFDQRTLSAFWKKAWNTVRALQLIDRINEWALDHARNPVAWRKPFVFSFDI
jgi:hypothetical protein